MKNQWQAILVKTTMWLLVEIFLNVVGLDNLADYSEFLSAREVGLQGTIAVTQVALANSSPSLRMTTP